MELPNELIELSSNWHILMLRAGNLPEFLWEPATAHAAYLRNRSHSRAVKQGTPYQIRHGNKPDVSHLREFRSPVWILTEGPNSPQKMLPKSIEKIFVGFDDGARAVKYYSKDMWKLLMSRNYQFLKPTPTVLPPTKNIPEPDHEVEGESDNLPSPSTEQIESSWPNKRPTDAISDESPKRTRCKIVDYKRLDNLYSDTDDDNDSMITIHLMISDETYSTACSNAPISLQEAKKSPDWPEWEKAIQDELDQLRDMGTWKLEKKPLDAISIANKWLFVKKTNISGQIEKYKARLVIKGCTQRLGFDFHETYSSVVRIETVRIIMVMVPQFNLKIQQMDIKGTFLNRILKEGVYMKQPEDFNDRTDRVCHLIKTLYSLKQAGREWNTQFNEGVEQMGFKRLLSDPCAYIRQQQGLQFCAESHNTFSHAFEVRREQNIGASCV